MRHYHYFWLSMIALFHAGNMWGMEIDDYADRYPLHQAVKEKNFSKVKKLLEGKNDDIDVDQPDAPYHFAPLHLASSSENSEIVSLLLFHRANVNVKSLLYETPLHKAASSEIAQLLIEHGAKINALDMNKYTPLHQASCRENSGIVSLLLERKANVNAKGFFLRTTPLHLAAYCNQVENVKLLIEYKAKIYVKDRQNLTPLDIARKEGHEEIVKVLNNAHQKKRTLEFLHLIRLKHKKEQTDHPLLHIPNEILEPIAEAAKEKE